MRLTGGSRDVNTDMVNSNDTVAHRY